MSSAVVLTARGQAFVLSYALGLSLLVACGDGIDIRLGGRRAHAVLPHEQRDAGAPGMAGDSSLLVTPRTDCTGLTCQVDECVGKSQKTRISGVVYDPAGKVPLYNVVVYVPNAPLNAIPTGVPQCQTCSGFFSGKPIAVALSDTDGHFTIQDVPVGHDIPLVIQVGKWRREITVPEVTACTDTLLTNPQQTRLPRDKSEGNIPKIAIATGGSDALECLVRKIGISDSEFTTEHGSGRVNLFAGYNAATTMVADGGTPLTPTDTLWGDKALLDRYDMMLMSCEGKASVTRTLEEYANVRSFADMGGRIFGSHWHHGWINPKHAPYPEVVKFSSGAHGFDPPDVPITVLIDTSFAKGDAFSKWLVNVGASTTPGLIDVRGAEHSVNSVVQGVAQQWIYGTDTVNTYSDGGATPMLQYFSLNTPIGGAECGRMVFSDLHVSSTGDMTDNGKLAFPSGCVDQPLSPQEKALEFMIFDLSSCIQKDTDPVRPPTFIR
jgi:hypothetical protein